MTTERTPGPFVAIDRYTPRGDTISGMDIVSEDDGHVLCRLPDGASTKGGHAFPRILANAKFIVKACNAHEALLDACEGLAALFPEDDMSKMDAADFKDRACETMALVDIAKAAIATLT